MMGDDVIVVPGSIANLAEEALAYDMILNPISNCDDINIINPIESGFTREVDPLKEEGDLHHLDDIPKQKPFIFPTHRLYTYATMFPRKVWSLVGPSDERFIEGFEDEDYCLRAALANVRLGILSNAFVFHYGHQTIKKLTQHNSADNYRQFFSKYGVMHIPPLTMPGFGAALLYGLQAIEQIKRLK